MKKRVLFALELRTIGSCENFRPTGLVYAKARAAMDEMNRRQQWFGDRFEYTVNLL